MIIMRRSEKYTAEGVEVTFVDFTWRRIRDRRQAVLTASDWRAMSDRELTNEWRDYRQFLRDLPQNYYDESDEVTQGANAAADAWEEYEKPEE